MITTQQVRIILDRNRNGLDGRPAVQPGQPMHPGVWWDASGRKVVRVESGRPAAEVACVLLSERLDITVDDLVRLLAMGGGGHSGRAVPYHAGAGSSQSHH